MPALNNTYRIQNNGFLISSILNDNFTIVSNKLIFRFPSTLFKESGEWSFTNKMEARKIISFAKLEKNWDGYNAEEISQIVIENALAIVSVINEHDEDVYFTSPGPNGEIMIQLKNEEREVEFIIYPAKSKFVKFTSNTFVSQGSFSISMLPEIINWLNS